MCQNCKSLPELNHSKVGAVGLYADMKVQKNPNKTEGLHLIKSHTVCVKAEAPMVHWIFTHLE